jgi:hypothetical protein
MKNSTLDADKSAYMLREAVIHHEPFFFARVGDGAIECLKNVRPAGAKTCDGEVYTDELREKLRCAIDTLKSSERVMWGDWRIADIGSEPKYVDEWVRLIQPDERALLSPEALLLNRQTEALRSFYSAIRNDGRNKLYVGPARNAEGARMMGSEHFIVPEPDMQRFLGHVEDELVALDYDILLFGAGLAGLCAAVAAFRAHPLRTYIHIGSALDPIGLKPNTRSGQLSPFKARKLLNGLL